VIGMPKRFYLFFVLSLLLCGSIIAEPGDDQEPTPRVCVVARARR
jgi:hypothetical protein